MGRIREIVEGVEVVSERAAKENNDDDSSFYTTDEEEEEEFADAESTSGDKTGNTVFQLFYQFNSHFILLEIHCGSSKGRPPTHRMVDAGMAMLGDGQ